MTAKPDFVDRWDLLRHCGQSKNIRKQFIRLRKQAVGTCTVEAGLGKKALLQSCGAKTYCTCAFSYCTENHGVPASVRRPRYQVPLTSHFFEATGRLRHRKHTEIFAIVGTSTNTCCRLRCVDHDDFGPLWSRKVLFLCCIVKLFVCWVVVGMR